MAIQSSRLWKDRAISPERTKVWTEPKSKNTEKKVPVVYYLSRNGHLEHPHFMEVSLSSSQGLYLKDVINRLNILRGRGMASMYSWSSKRSYKNGFVWHDLCEDDFIYPAHGHEYVLKGSEMLNLSSSSSTSKDLSSSSSSERGLDIPPKTDDSELALIRRKKKTPWNSLDLNEYKVYKSELNADASTQTDDKKSHRRRSRAEIPNSEEEDQNPNPSSDAVLDRDEIEISPPPSSSSPEALESLIKADGRLIAVGSDDQDRTVGNNSSGRFRASAVLMQLVSCGSISVKERPTRGVQDSARKEMDGVIGVSSFGALTVEDKEYFSGSVIEMKKTEADGGAAFPVLKRSNSYNADRSSEKKEIDGARGKCGPRKTKIPAPAAAAAAAAGGGGGRRVGASSICRSAHGSKRIDVDESSN